MENKTYVNLETRTIFIAEELTTQNIGFVSFNLLHMIQEDNENEQTIKDYERQPINIFIASPGGEVTATWGLIDIIEASETPIYTYCSSYCYSMAFTLFLSGHKRYGYKHSRFMYHDVSHTTGGYRFLQDIDELLKDSEKGRKAIVEFITDKTKITYDQLKEVQEKKQNWFIEMDEALSLGIATDIIS